MLELKEISVGYGKIESLSGINLKILENEIVALIGANGAGKSTLLKSISGLLSPHRGKMLYRKLNITKTTPKKRVELGIAQVPEGRRLFGALSVEDNLLLGAYTRDDNEIERDLESIYERFPILKERRKKHSNSLSGGEQQMLAVGRALMSRPKLLLLDEPSMGLAPVVVEEIFDVIEALQRGGTTIFLVEQNATLALKHSNRAYLLENGKVVKSGDSQQLLQDSAVIDAYLGSSL
jgi:branched-chain amino acid transport system ATP-binding protein